jgi:hypothetical protein
MGKNECRLPKLSLYLRSFSHWDSSTVGLNCFNSLISQMLEIGERFFLGQISVSFSVPSPLYPNYHSWNRIFIHCPYLNQSFSVKNPIVRKRYHSCDTTSAGQCDWDISHLVGKFLPSCDGNQNSAPCKLFTIPWGLVWELNNFDFIHIQGLHSLPSSSQIFIDWPVRPEEAISRCQAFNTHIDFIYRSDILYCCEWSCPFPRFWSFRVWD